MQILDQQALLILEDHVLYLVHNGPLLIHQPLDEDVQGVVLRELVFEIWETSVEDREPVVRRVCALFLYAAGVQLPLVQVVFLVMVEVFLWYPTQYLVDLVVNAILMKVLEECR